MIRPVSVAVLLAVAATTPVAAQNMPLPAFVERATKLEKKRPLALFHKGEINALMTEMRGANERLRADRVAAEERGGNPGYCIPKERKGVRVGWGSQELLRELRAIPAAQARTMNTTDGMRVLLAKRYPCRT